MTGGERPRRSALYLPASNPRAIAKARDLPCDVVILDLEDAVGPDAKAQARDAAVAAIREGGFGRRELVVRVNALSGPWGADDCAALAGMGAGMAPAAVLLPKIDDAAGVAAYAARLGAVPLWAMIETAAAVLRLDAIGGAPGLAALVIGTNDLAKELRVRPGPDRLPLLGFLAQTVAAARAHRLAVLDGVYNAIGDPDGLARECAEGARFGFDGKTLIHPSQIAACNAAFSPGADEVARAGAIVAAFADPAARGRGVLRLGDEMVERLHLEDAHRVLALAGAAID